LIATNQLAREHMLGVFVGDPSQLLSTPNNLKTREFDEQHAKEIAASMRESGGPSAGVHYSILAMLSQSMSIYS
jgi:hypothetical protein